jgi:hypothetical protein
MLWLSAVILIGLWLLGMITSHTMGGLIHLAPAAVIIIVLINLYRGGSVLGGGKRS